VTVYPSDTVRTYGQLEKHESLFLFTLAFAQCPDRPTP